MKLSRGSALAMLLLPCSLFLGSLARAEALEPAKATASDPCHGDGKDSVAVCWDGFEAGQWDKLTQCLQDALKREEAALADSLAKAVELAHSADKLSAKRTLDESNAQWAKYRDSECDRQMAFVAGRNHPDIGELTCKIRETAERVADLHFDDNPPPGQ